MVHKSQYLPEHQQLLRDLKIIAEGLLESHVANLWSIYGGLNRLYNVVEKIFLHGCKKTQEEFGFYSFVQGLEWLQPDNIKCYFSVDCEYRPHLPPHLKDDKASIWLYRSIESHSLSTKLSWLLSDKVHLHECYFEYAFLCQEEYTEAVLICLRAIERNQPSLLLEINPHLFVQKLNFGVISKAHRRCSSFPDNHLKNIMEERKRSMTIGSSFCHSRKSSKIKAKPKLIQGKLKPWQSMPNLLQSVKIVSVDKKTFHSRTTPSTPVNSKKIDKIPLSALKVDYSIPEKKQKKSNLKKNFIKKPYSDAKRVIIDNCDIVEHTPPLSSPSDSNTVIPVKNTLYSSTETLFNTKSSLLSISPRIDHEFLPQPGEKDYKRKPKKTFIEDGGMSVLPMATGYFPKPTKGQSLMSFLTSSHFSRSNAELDRENAHFFISEAIIQAMEQIKCRRDEHLSEEQLDDSDPEIIELKQRIRLRRRQKIVEKHRGVSGEALLSDGKTDTTTSVSPLSSTPDTYTDLSSESVDDLELDEASNLEDHKGLSMSMASLYSEADLRRPRGAPDGASDVLSAEGLALSLISKFNEKQLPKASDLVWLVSEEDAPQALLPLPKSLPINPDDTEPYPTPLRGTQEWAPPRAQIIFTLHPPEPKKKVLAKQNHRCAGCSMKVSPKYFSTFRYCNYLGRYFCTKCHTNQLALIPARILQKWDFARYPVSTFSYRLLEQMYTDPLFRVFDLNKEIGKHSKNLLFCKKYRLGIFYLKDFILTCKYAQNIKVRLEVEMSYALSEPEVYSIEDLVLIKSGEMKEKLLNLVDICCRHTLECKLCISRGFYCEICHADEVIFPWQLSKVSRCDKCHVCYHLKCCDLQTKPCPKCVRVQMRRESLGCSSKSDL